MDMAASRRCLKHARTRPSSPAVTSASAPARITLFRCYKRDIYRVIQHICRVEMPNAALFFCSVSTFVENLALHCSFFGGSGQVWKKQSHLFTEDFNFNFVFFFLNWFDALWYCLDHCTIINCMHTNRKWVIMIYCETQEKKNTKKNKTQSLET